MGRGSGVGASGSRDRRFPRSYWTEMYCRADRCRLPSLIFRIRGGKAGCRQGLPSCEYDLIIATT